MDRRALLLASTAAFVAVGLAGCTSPNTSSDQSPTRSPAKLVIGVPGTPNTTIAELGSTTFCPSGGDPVQSYPVTDQATGLS